MLIKPIQVLASFDLKGNMLPLYLKIDGVKLKVDYATKVNEIYGSKSFNCTVIDGNYKKQVQVVYKLNETTWYLSDGKF